MPLENPGVSPMELSPYAQRGQGQNEVVPYGKGDKKCG
jgi:hypothetical protein